MPDCKTCKTERRQAADVPYIVHESDMARLERTIKRQWAVIILLIVMLAASVTFIVWRITQFETQYAEIEVDTGKGDAYVAGIGDVTIGESESQNSENDP